MLLINADALLGILLLKRPKVTFSQLLILRDKVESENSDIYIDISAPEIEHAVFYHSYLFSRHLGSKGQPGYVARVPENDHLFEPGLFEPSHVELVLLGNIPKNIREKIEKAFEAIENVG